MEIIAVVQVFGVGKGTFWLRVKTLAYKCVKEY